MDNDQTIEEALQAMKWLARNGAKLHLTEESSYERQGDTNVCVGRRIIVSDRPTEDWE